MIQIFLEPGQSCLEVSVRAACFSASLQLSEQHSHRSRAKDELKSFGGRGTVIIVHLYVMIRCLIRYRDSAVRRSKLSSIMIL